MFAQYEGLTADDAWLKAAADFRDGRGFAVQAGRGGTTYEVLHACIGVADPRQRWVVSREKPLNLPFALAEVVWILNGRDDAKAVKYFNPRLPRYTGDAAHLHGAYGRRLRSHLGFDQLVGAYRALSADATSRQVVLQIWDGKIDFPPDNGAARSPDIPCNITALLKVRGGKLEWAQIMRSNDLYKGLPYNLVQFTSLQEVLAGWLDLEVGGYHHLSDSLHVYAGEEEEWIRRSRAIPVETSTDSLALPFEESSACWSALGRLVDEIIEEARSGSDLMQRLFAMQLAAPFKNIACVLVADGLRRRRCPAEMMNAAMEGCTNGAYRQLWQRWSGRFVAAANRTSPDEGGVSSKA